MHALLIDEHIAAEEGRGVQQTRARAPQQLRDVDRPRADEEVGAGDGHLPVARRARGAERGVRLRLARARLDVVRLGLLSGLAQLGEDVRDVGHREGHFARRGGRRGGRRDGLGSLWSDHHLSL